MNKVIMDMTTSLINDLASQREEILDELITAIDYSHWNCDSDRETG